MRPGTSDSVAQRKSEASSLTASAPPVHKGGLTIMAGRRPELGTQHVERVTGIEPALSAWEASENGC
jgi:hypothetical protein